MSAFEADRFNHSRTSPRQNSRQLSAVSRQQSSLRSEWRAHKASA